MNEGLLYAIQQWDQAVVVAAVSWTESMQWREYLAAFLSDYLFLLLVLPAPLVLWYDREPRGRHHGNKKAVVLAALSVVVAVALKTVFAALFFRERPDLVSPDLLPLDPQSFPSGHVLVSMTLAVSLFLSGMRTLGGVLIGGAVLVGVGRVLVGAHFPTDVLGGILFAACIAWLLHHESSSIKKYLPNT